MKPVPWDMEDESSFFRPAFSRRRFLKFGAGAAAGLAIYAGEIERHWIEITRRDIQLKNLPRAFDGIRIAQMSDIHMDEFTEPYFLRMAIEKINSLHPDFVLLTGDFVSNGISSTKFSIGAGWQCANLLTAIECERVYAILGNHDVLVSAKDISAALRANGIQVLRNACLPLDRAGARVWLAGLDDPVEGHPDPDLAIPEYIRNVPDEPIILMCHAPDYVDELLLSSAGKAVDLMLSGHTHGGQVRVPFVGAIALPILGKKYVEGWFPLGRMQLYVNRGVGTVGLPFRFDCPPEISLLTLRTA